MTKKQAAALKKGRAALARKRKAAGMQGIDGRKRRKGKGKRQVIIIRGGQGGEAGIEGRRRRRRRHSYMMGGVAMSKKPDIAASALDIGVTLGGAVLGSLLAGKMLAAVKDPKIRAAIPAAAGIIGAAMIKQPIIKHALNGVAIGGGLALIKQTAPQLGLAGLVEDSTLEGQSLVIEPTLKAEIDKYIDQYKATMGAIETSGEDTETMGAIETSGEDMEGEDIEGDDTEVLGTLEQSGEDIEGEETDISGRRRRHRYITSANL